MNWEAISTIAEIIGAAAVVISLIYLAVQIRQNNRQVEEQIRALRLQAYDAAGADFSALRLHISASPQLASVWRRAKEIGIEDARFVQFMDKGIKMEEVTVNKDLDGFFVSYKGDKSKVAQIYQLFDKRNRKPI